MAEEQTNETPEPEIPTLDQVYSEFNVQEQAQQFTEQVQQPRSMPETPAIPQVQPNVPNTPVIPDPTLDPDGYRAYMASLQQNQTQIAQQFGQQISTVQQELDALRQEKVQAEAAKDLNAAVDTLANHASGIDRELLKGALFAKANDDPRFLQIWEGRHQNPQAYEKALAALGREVANKVPTVDPDVAEGQRALREATQRESSVNYTNDVETELESLSDAEFMSRMRALERG